MFKSVLFIVMLVVLNIYSYPMNADTIRLHGSPAMGSMRAEADSTLVPLMQLNDSLGVRAPILHGVDSGTVPQAISTTELGNTPITIAIDSVKISFTGTPGDTFIASGVSGPASSVFYSGCSAPNEDCYYGVGSSVSDNGWYIQTGGVGALTKVTGTPYGKTPVGMACDLDTNIYGAVYNGWIYKRTSGAGNFDTIPGTIKLWSDITCDIYGLLYGTTYGDTIYTSSDEGVTWDFFQKLDDVRKICADYIGGVWAIDGDGPGDIYYKPIGGTFSGVGNNNSWYSIGCDKNGNVYASTSSADGLYTSFGGTGSFIKTQEQHAFNDIFGKEDSTTAALITNDIWLKTNDPLNTILDVSGGNTDLHGKLSVDNVPTTTTAEYVIVKNEWPDHGIYKTSVDSLITDAIVDTINNRMGVGIEGFIPRYVTEHMFSPTYFYVSGNIIYNDEAGFIGIAGTNSSYGTYISSGGTPDRDSGGYVQCNGVNDDSAYILIMPAYDAGFVKIGGNTIRWMGNSDDDIQWQMSTGGGDGIQVKAHQGLYRIMSDGCENGLEVEDDTATIENSRSDYQITDTVSQRTTHAKSVTDEVTTKLFDVAVASGDAVGGTVSYTIYVKDALSAITQVREGSFTFAAKNASGTVSTDIDESSDQSEVITGSLTDTWTVTDGTNKADINVNVNTDISSPTIIVEMYINIKSMGVITKN